MEKNSIQVSRAIRLGFLCSLVSVRCEASKSNRWRKRLLARSIVFRAEGPAAARAQHMAAANARAEARACMHKL